MDAPALPRKFDGYELRRLLGRGGMGEVHLAHDTFLDRPVAVKFILAHLADETARKRFLIEARAVARLQHPNVVTIHRVGEVDGTPYLVSEFVRGKPLDALPLPADAALVLRVALDITNGLAAAHRQGVIHRDVKPANAMLTTDGQVKLLDFGIAKLLEPVRGTGALEVLPQEQRLSSEPTLSAMDLEQESTVAAVGASGAVAAAAASGAVAAVSVSGAVAAVGVSGAVAAMGASGAAAATAQTLAAGAECLLLDTVRLRKDPALDRLHDAIAQRQQLVAPLDLTATGALLGTPVYMAPEIWRGEPATFRSDVYSLGALLYTLAAGRPPHQGDSLPQLAERVLHGEARPLAQRASDLDPRLCDVVDRCLTRDPAARFATANEVREQLIALTPAARSRVAPAGNPYRGLSAFEAQHHDVFFGRDSETRMILDRLIADSFVLVVGDSGVGKSSLCRAGVLPCLQEHPLEGRQWSTVTFVPGREPLAAFARAVAPLLGVDEDALARDTRDDARGVIRRLRAWHSDARGLVVFVDQLEELVTLSDAAQTPAFAELLRWLAEPSPAVRVLGTIRGDFLSRLAELPPLTEPVSRALYFLRPLNAERMREAITEPALAKGVSFSPPELVDGLVDSAQGAGGGLPLLQFALAELWEARDRGARVISQSALDAIGGVAGALNRHADNVLRQLTAPARAAARKVLLRLVTADGTRVRRTAAALEAEDEPNRAALHALVRGRLVVARDTPEGPAYEIAHEVLVRGWTALYEWLSNDAELRRVHEHLHRAVSEWDRLGEASDVLWSRRQLREAQRFEPGELTRREHAFLRSSRRVARRARLLRVVAVIALPLLALGSYGGVWWKSRRDLRRTVDTKLTLAKAGLAEARARRAGALRLRRQALGLFDGQKIKEAERVWSRYLQAAARVQPGYVRASQALETALLLDRARADVRSLFADVLFERALLAEQRHRHTELDELLRRLSLYDQDGQRRRRWDAPGALTLLPQPAAAQVELHRYLLDKARRYRLAPVKTAGGGLSAERLPPGSYLAVLRAPGRAEVRYPFVIRRGERRRIEIVLPKAARIPSGFTYVSPGPFLFGSAAKDELRRDFFHTVPRHRVFTKAYLIARHETTFAEWLAYLRELPAAARARNIPRVHKGGFKGALQLEQLPDGGWQIAMQPTTQKYTARSGAEIVYRDRPRRAAQDWTRMPVVGVTAADAERYAAWLARTGRVRGARLCTEHEWERGARGSDGRAYPHGEALRPEDANYDDTYGKRPLAMGPDAVGSYPASMSPFLLHDMAGNVWEWTRSSVQPGKYAARGGSWYFGANSSRSSDREVTEPSFRDLSVGFRICADFEPAPHLRP